MSEKRVFPDDWSNFTDEQAVENIEYLKKNYSKYEINIPKQGLVIIGNVRMERKIKLDTKGKIHLVSVINNKELDADEIRGTWGMLMLLEYECQKKIKKDSMSSKEKVADWLKKNKAVFINTGITVATIAAFIAMWNYFVNNYDMAVTIRTHDKPVPNNYNKYNNVVDTVTYSQDTVKIK